MTSNAAEPKTSVHDLAVFTGVPAFASPLFVGMPTDVPPEEFVVRARQIFERRWFTNDGLCLREFESRICDEFDVAHAIAVSNGTVAIELVLRAIGATGEVIVPSFTFVATAHAALWQGLTPVFCDVDPITHNLDPGHVRQLITERTSAVVGVHLWGRPAYSPELDELVHQHGLRLLFDASHAFGCSAGGVPVGGRGDAETLSFHATKIVSAFEGGAVLTNDDELAHQIRLLRNFGFVDYDDVRVLGTNAKLNEISAAMGLASMDQFDRIVARNRRNYERYREQLATVRGVSMVRYDEAEQNNFQYVVLELDPGEAGLARDDLVRLLHSENVIARRYFHPGCHRMEPYRSINPHLSLPVTERLGERTVVVPTGDAVDEGTVDAICGLIKIALENVDALPDRFPDFRRGIMESP